MRLRCYALLAAAAVTLALAPEAVAQRPYAPPAPDKKVAADATPARSNTQGLFLRTHLNGIGLSLDQGDAESGGGLGVKAGYGFSRLFTLYLGFDAASMESGEYSYALVDLGAQLNFGSATSTLIPYLDFALSGQAAVMDMYGSNATMSGNGFTLGGGVKYFVSPVLALDAALLATPGAFNQISYQGQSGDVDFSTSGGRFTLGLSWFPSR